MGSDGDRVKKDLTAPGSRQQTQAWFFQERLLSERLYLQSLVRFFLVGGIIVGTLFAEHVVGVEGLHARGLIGLALVLGAFNVGAFWASRQLRGSELLPANFHLLQSIMHLTITADLFFITVGLWFVGEPKSPFQSFYLLHLMLASVLLSRRAAFAHALSAYTQFSGLVLGQWFELIPVRFPEGAVNSATPLDGRFVLTVLFVQGLLMGLTVYLVTGLAALLRAGEGRIQQVNAALKRLSAMRQGFLQITLHDLKAPVDAATMLLRNVTDGLCGPVTEKQQEWLGKCQKRLRELVSLLYDFEVLAMLDSETIEKQRRAVDINAVLTGVAEEYQEIAQAHGHTLEFGMRNGIGSVLGIERLIHEAVANLVTNAIKYTPDGGTIMMRAVRDGETITIEVKDNGIGIAEEDRPRLFGEFVRLQRGKDQTRNSPGSGLGLSIVKRVVDLHGGRVELESAPGVGSVFRMELPACAESAAGFPDADTESSP